MATKTIIFPPVEVPTELKLKRLLETIEDYMDVELVVDYVIRHNAMLLRVTFQNDRCDIEELLRAISECTEKTSGVKVT